MMSNLMLQCHVSLQKLSWLPPHSIRNQRKTLQNGSETYTAIGTAAVGALTTAVGAVCARAVTESISLQLASRR